MDKENKKYTVGKIAFFLVAMYGMFVLDMYLIASLIS